MSHSPGIVLFPAFALMGGAAAWMYLALLSLWVRRLTGLRGTPLVLALSALRIPLTVALLVVAAWQGALALIAALVSFLAIRVVLLRHPGLVGA